MVLLKSIKSKILVFAIMATLIPSLGLGLLSFRQNEAQTSDTVNRELRALASQASRELELWINKHIHSVRALSTSNAVIDGLSATSHPHAGMSNKTPQALTHYLRSVQSKLDTIIELTVVGAAGQIVASSAAPPSVLNLPQSWPESAFTEGVVLEPPHWDKLHGTATFSVAVPVLSYDNVLMGALVAVLDLRTAQPYLKSSTKSPLGEVLLLDQNGRALLSSHADKIKRISLDALILRQLLAKPGESMTFQGLMNREVIGVADTPAALPITVVAERERADIYAAWVDLRNQFLALVCILVLVVAAVAFRMGRSIVTPLQHLIVAANSIADGDLDVQLPVTRNDEFGHLTLIFNRMADKLRHSHAEVVATNQAMQQQNTLLETLSVTDGLTGLYNRSKLDVILKDELARFNRNQRPFAVLMMDIDNFKTLNDNHGHIAGDEVIVAVAKILSQSIRSVDYAARYGGDEFVIIMVETTADMAFITAERILSRVNDMRYSANGKIISVTVSIGVVQCQQSDNASPTAVFARADSALYEAKRAGRNQAHYAT
ncbi:sensor domain-containing diguanylate cyclase [Candidatus Nitrotoga sp. M5]|uniref:sensor domain-containing diguanylate cyclase n=1 Tax=Candidatus Nitrotoga sp. M5 TaxID=2890409 RepID=UPI001EF19FD4|nr:diguanylate cyclase [Candidatus Nitrotoga sp. M5]CAH1385133.1 Diguanylate cyclase (GGDEF) domain-containing protein [Candidatus Nitrotoga sp. M5]